eukprot:Plantae.Rhodophyta-Hildenbrandia_rubra.ctg31658.p1 GENE.Plantae.Rhodophyta-Hildenbrandia_rubra.ctg31658~~Plantae.Rhodophyta-Hildenbrandia_rubra.ctg31658.p1  ORF type:complete len:103 (-),score=17.85 Plantae.Rhodophyta-Hildenbrandia_rubra.ctg31658:202-510(-)
MGHFVVGYARSLKKATLIIIARCKLRNFLIDQNDAQALERPAEENQVEGEPVAQIQDELAFAEEFRRGIRRGREETVRRNAAARDIERMGRQRPPRMPQRGS